VLIEERLEVHNGQPVHIRKCSYLIQVASDSFLLPDYLIDAVGDNDFLPESAPHNEVIEPQAMPLSQHMDTSAFFLCTAYRYGCVSFSHVIILLFLMPIKVGSGFCPTSKAAGGMPAAMLANPKGLIFSGTTTFLLCR